MSNMTDIIGGRSWTSEQVGQRTILRCDGEVVGGYERYGVWRGSINPQRRYYTIALHGTELRTGHTHDSTALAVREVVTAWLGASERPDCPALNGGPCNCEQRQHGSRY